MGMGFRVKTIGTIQGAALKPNREPASGAIGQALGNDGVNV